MSGSQRLARSTDDRGLLGSLAALHERSLDAVLVAEADGSGTHGPVVLHVNAAFTALSGFSLADLVGRSCAWLEPPGDGEAECALRMALTAGQPARLELTLPRKDATPCRVEISLLPVGQGGGPVCGFIVTTREASAGREAERARRQAEAQFRDAVDTISEGLAICDADDRLIICNKRFLQTLPQLRALGDLPGRPYEELVRFAASQGDVLDPEMKRDPERWIALRLERHRAASGTPYLRRLPDGRWLQMTEHRSSTGGIVTVLSDVTPAKQAETRLRDAIESIDAVFTLWDDEARLLMWNKRFPETWPELANLLKPGVTQQALIERNIDRGVLQIPAEERQNYIQSRLERHRAPASEVELKRADGRVFLIRAHRTAEGGQVRLESDITELKQRERELRVAKDVAEAANLAAIAEVAAHKRAAEALARSQQHLKHAQRIADTGSIERDLTTGAAVWSDELYRILGVGRDFPPTFENFLGLVHEEDRARFAAAMQGIAAAKPGVQIRVEECRIVRPDGAVRVLQPVWEVMFDDDGRATHFFAALKDVTELRAAEARRREIEQQLQHSQKLEALGTLAGGVAHELNNTLVPILALTKITANRLAGGSRERANMDTVLRAGERARDLVQQILAFSRKETPARQRLDAGALVCEALKMLRASLPSTIHIAETIGAAPPVLADPNQLYQIVTNLLTNAAQAIGSRIGSIAVEVGAVAGDSLAQTSGAAPATAFRLAVRDTGCGMDEATQRRIFEPFFTTKPVGEGTGLGLAMVHGIVADHGGRIAVTSELGRGTRVEVFLPASVD